LQLDGVEDRLATLHNIYKTVEAEENDGRSRLIRDYNEI
jgi:hypothetical protein